MYFGRQLPTANIKPAYGRPAPGLDRPGHVVSASMSHPHPCSGSVLRACVRASDRCASSFPPVHLRIQRIHSVAGRCPRQVPQGELTAVQCCIIIKTASPVCLLEGWEAPLLPAPGLGLSHSHRCLISCVVVCHPGRKVLRLAANTVAAHLRGGYGGDGRVWGSRIRIPDAVWCTVLWL